jgi:N-acetylglucosamine kinase-like BadF-type ATPase
VFGLLGFARGDEVNALEGWAAALSEPRTQIAALAPVALRLAEAGDVAARAIVDRAADELAWHVHMLERKLGAPTMAWSYAGGLFASAVLREAVVERIGREPRLPRLPPIGGALLAAVQHLGRQPDEAFIARLASSIAAAPTQVQEAKSTQETGNA